MMNFLSKRLGDWAKRRLGEAAKDSPSALAPRLVVLSSLFSLLFLISCALQPITEPRRVDWSGEPTPLPTIEAVAKPTYVVEQGRVAQELLLVGRVGSAVEAPLASVRDGIITAVFVTNGSSVVEGDILATLDSAAVDAQIETIRFELDTLESRLAETVAGLEAQQRAAELALERANTRLATAQSQFGNTPTESQLADLRILEIDVELAQIRLDQVDLTVDPLLENRIDELRIELQGLEAEKATFVLIAPVDGDLANINLAMGGRVREGNSIGLVVDLDQMVVWGDVVESELDQLEEGMPVLLSVPGTETAVSGTIALLPFPYGNGEFSVRETAVQAIPDDPSFLDSFTLGDRIDITIVLAENEDAVWLPPAALREFGGQSFVIVRTADGNQRADIELGIVGNGRVEIAEGLEAGQIVEAP